MHHIVQEIAFINEPQSRPSDDLELEFTVGACSVKPYWNVMVSFARPASL
jgi:hypothetical protein